MTKDDREERQTITVPEAGKILGISRNAAYDAAKRGDLPIIRIGGRILVSLPGLRRMIDQGEGPPR
jgi:excisionase family DNA binding protein